MRAFTRQEALPIAQRPVRSFTGTDFADQAHLILQTAACSTGLEQLVLLFSKLASGSGLNTRAVVKTWSPVC